MMEKRKVWKYAAWVFIILAVFLAVQALSSLKNLKYIGRDVPPMTSITVSGRGEVVAIPDVATFSFSVVEEGSTVSTAQEKATNKINNVLGRLRDAGVAEADIKTTSYNINPRYNYPAVICNQFGCPPSRQVLTGYEVSQSILVKVRDTAQAGELLTVIGQAEVSNVSGLSFTVDDLESIKAQARGKAIADAQAKAKILAKDLDVRLVRVISYYDSNDEPRPYYDYAVAGMGGDGLKVAPPQVPVGENEIISQVNVTYEIR